MTKLMKISLVSVLLATGAMATTTHLPELTLDRDGIDIEAGDTLQLDGYYLYNGGTIHKVASTKGSSGNATITCANESAQVINLYNIKQDTENFESIKDKLVASIGNCRECNKAGAHCYNEGSLTYTPKALYKVMAPGGLVLTGDNAVTVATGKTITQRDAGLFESINLIGNKDDAAIYDDHTIFNLVAPAGTASSIMTIINQQDYDNLQAAISAITESDDYKNAQKAVTSAQTTLDAATAAEEAMQATFDASAGALEKLENGETVEGYDSNDLIIQKVKDAITAKKALDDAQKTYDNAVPDEEKATAEATLNAAQTAVRNLNNELTLKKDALAQAKSDFDNAQTKLNDVAPQLPSLRTVAESSNTLLENVSFAFVSIPGAGEMATDIEFIATAKTPAIFALDNFTEFDQTIHLKGTEVNLLSGRTDITMQGGIVSEKDSSDAVAGITCDANNHRITFAKEVDMSKANATFQNGNFVFRGKLTV